MLTPRRRLFILLSIALAIGAAVALGYRRLHVDSDLTAALPQNDPVVRAAQTILTNNVILDRILIDLSLTDGKGDAELLVKAAGAVEELVAGSGVVNLVAADFTTKAGPALAAQIVTNLPLLFDRRELDEQVAPLLAAGTLPQIMDENRLLLMDLRSIGQADMIQKDPLRLRNIVFARLGARNPFGQVRILQGRLVTPDERHLLLIATPAVAGTKRPAPEAIDDFLNSVPAKLRAIDPALSGVTLKHFGAYRPAVDNEKIIRRDATRALLVSSLGIAALLLLFFPRPQIGLLAFLPAFAGAGLGVFVYTLLYPRISGLSLGFGGALLSITIDAPIAYLLFMDQIRRTTAGETRRQIWSGSLFSALTTVGGFLALLVSGFPILQQLGVIVALGSAFSLVFVLLVYALLLPALPPANRAARLSAAKIARAGRLVRGWRLAIAAAVFFAVMAILAKPRFDIDLDAMNTVTAPTAAAEKELRGRWEGEMSRAYVFLQADSAADLQKKADRLADFLDAESAAGVILPALSPADLCPGPERAAANLRAWREFWSPERRTRLSAALRPAAVEAGFTADAFASFLQTTADADVRPGPIPDALFEMLGVSPQKGGPGFSLFTAAPHGPAFNAEAFYRRAAAMGLTVYEPRLFAAHLAQLLSDSFVKMLLIIGVSLVVLLFALYADWVMVLLAMAPVIFAFVCTLGTLKLLGRPLDIPSLMLSVVILGMGVNYGLYLICWRQRYPVAGHPGAQTTADAVFINAAATVVGMLSLFFASHSVLRSAGVTATLGLAYSFIGAVCLLPYPLELLFKARAASGEAAPVGSAQQRRLVRRRFAHLEAYPRFFAACKMRLDPMFPRLAEFVPATGTIVDVGCGYGVPAAWLSTAHPALQFLGVEPNANRAAIAARVIGPAGRVVQSSAPDLPWDQIPDADAVLLLDMLHCLADADLARTLDGLAARLKPNGRLVIRVTIPSGKKLAWERWLEKFRLAIGGCPCVFRSEEEMSEALGQAKFVVEIVEPTAPAREETWFIARKA